MKEKVTIKKSRTVRVDSELWHTSWSLLKSGQENKLGSTHQFRASLVFTVFALEAYLNHLGSQLLKSWGSIERKLSPTDKLDLLCEHLKIEAGWSKRPWQTINDLLSYRNSLAHGRGEKLLEEYQDSVEHYLVRYYEFPRTEWEKYCTMEMAERARDDVEKIANLLHEKGGARRDFPFFSGLSMSSAGLT